MGQNASTEGGTIHGKENIDEIVSDIKSSQKINHANHEYFISNGDLETVGDLDSILQAMSVTPTTPESEGSVFG